MNGNVQLSGVWIVDVSSVLVILIARQRCADKRRYK